MRNSGFIDVENFEKDPRNISMEEAIKIIEEEGFGYKVGSDPFEEIRRK